MNPNFSVDDLNDSFWTPPDPAEDQTPVNGMARSQSEWAFQKLLEEIFVSAESPIHSSSATHNAISRSPSQLQSEPSVSRQEEAASDISNVVHIQKPQDNRLHIDPNHCQAILKRKLELACAAVALRVASVKPEDSSGSSVNQKQPVPIASQTQGSVVAKMSPTVSSVSTTPSLGTQNKQDFQTRQATSVSSRDDSGEDDLDGDTETTENADPADIKRAKRMLSNRESARRSRRRKQEQMNELDTQVGQLRTEHTTLLKRLSEMNQKYDMAAVDNRILKADIETLRTKVKMAEETVKRVTGLNPLLVARRNSSTTDLNHNLKPAIPNVTSMIPNQRLENNYFANNEVVVPLNVNPVSNTGLKNPTKVPPFPENGTITNHLPEEMNTFVPRSCNAYETRPHWNLAERKNKPQE